MTLPASSAVSPMAFSMINGELQQPASTTLSIDSTPARTLANVPASTIKTSDFYGKPIAPGAGIAVYYGVSTQPLIANVPIPSLTTVVIAAYPFDFTITAPPSYYEYFLSPVSAGTLVFFDKESSFLGGWDGAFNDDFATFGPKTISVDGVPYYAYRSDFSSLGACSWQVRLG